MGLVQKKEMLHFDLKKSKFLAVQRLWHWFDEDWVKSQRLLAETRHKPSNEATTPLRRCYPGEF